MNRLSAAFGLLLWLNLVSSSLSAENWPEFRGPTGEGLSAAKDLPLEWSIEKNVAWKTEVPGQGWSSPAYVDGKLYLTSAIPASEEEISLTAFCFSGADGTKLWEQTVFVQKPDAPKIHSKNSHASPSPIVAEGRVFVHFGHLGTACLDLEGKVIWKQTGLTYRPVHGNGGSPILVGGKLVFSIDGAKQRMVVALDRTTGEVIWKAERQGDPPRKFSFSTPLLIEVDGQEQIISPGSGRVDAIDPKSGETIWYATYGSGYSVIPRPVFAHGLVYIATGYNRPKVMAIRPNGTGDVTSTHVVWEESKGAPHTPSLLVVGDELYMVSDAGVATCLDASTGETHWIQRLPGNYSASPLHANGYIYFQNETGVGTVVKAGKEFELVSKNDLESRTLASYAVGGAALFIRTADALFRIEGK